MNLNLNRWVPKKVSEKPRDFSIDLPGSKSISLRTLVLASLASGTSRIAGLPDCDDVTELTGALRTLGVEINVSENGTYTVKGTSGNFSKGRLDIQLGLSGTSTRFLIALAFLRKDETHIDGDESLRVRPNKFLLDALKCLGAHIDPAEASGLPVLIRGCPTTLQRSVEMTGNRSSQYFSALMQVAPLLTKGMRIKVRGELVSRPYIDITIAQMKAFNVNVGWSYETSTFDILPQTYQAADLRVEGDASGASYFAALSVVHGTAVTFCNLGKKSLQGDYKFLQLCERLGATIESSVDTTTIIGPTDGMNAVDEEIDMEDMPDVAPTLMAIAPLVPGGLRIRGLGTLRIKECDRLKVCAQHLQSLGVHVEEGPDYIVIKEHDAYPAELVELETYDDHRIAMSFAVLASKMGNIAILNSSCVAKTFPRYWNELEKFGIRNAEMML